MQIEIKGLDQRTLNRARKYLDEAGYRYSERPEADDDLPIGEVPMALIFTSDKPAALRHFVSVALYDPTEKVYR
jgi:hypothetical protein